MQKISTTSDSCPQNDRTVSDSYGGVQTFMGITENHLTEVQFTGEDLLERILSPSNMNLAYKRVLSNGGSGGVDKLETEDLLPYLLLHKDATRTMNSITRFIEDCLFLTVNKEKTRVGYVQGMKFLGYSFYVQKGSCRLSVHPRSYKKLKVELKRLTGRINGMGYEYRKRCLHLFIRGWVEYFKLADMRNRLSTIDEWYRRRLRMCIWKSWKKVKTRIGNLMRCGLGKEVAYMCGNHSKSYWYISGTLNLQQAMSINNLRKSGYPMLFDYYSKLHRK